MDPATLAAIMGGVGLLKQFAIDQPAAKRERQVQAVTERYSPWTGQAGHSVQDPNAGNTLLQYGTTGASLGQNAQNSALDQAYKKALISRINNGASDNMFAGIGGGNAGNSAGSGMSPYGSIT